MRGEANACARLVINEVQVSGPLRAGDEFIELFNAGTCPVALEGWSIRYMPASGANGHRHWAPTSAGRSVAPGTFFVIASKSYAGANKDDDATAAQGMADKGGLALFFNDVLVDSVAWGAVIRGHAYVEAAAAGVIPKARSLVRVADGIDTNHNAADFRIAAPTPGSSNGAAPLVAAQQFDDRAASARRGGFAGAFELAGP